MTKKPLALIIANKMIFPSLDGGSMAMKKLSEVLIDQNYHLDIISISKKNANRQNLTPIISKIDNNITQIIFEKNMNFNILNFFQSILDRTAYQASRFYHKTIKKFIQNSITKKDYNIIIFESIFTTIYLDRLIFSKSVKTVLRAHNIEHKIWENLAKSSFIKKIPYLFLAKQIQKMEETIPKNIDHILTLSTYDQEYFSELFPKKTENIPVTFDIKPTYKTKIKNSIFHLGAMDWKPNIEGIDWFVKKVLPKIEEDEENIKTYLAGKGMPEKYMNYNTSKTTVEGKIQNAQEYIQNKEIMFVPLFSGSGIRIKILEGMSLGIPVVSTTKAAEGIPYINQKNILIADTPIAFKEAICLLIKNKKLAQKIGDNGRKLIESNFSKNFAINKWKKVIR